MRQTDNLRIRAFEPLTTPKQLKHIVPLEDEAAETVDRARAQIIRIMTREDPRRLLVVGPCSIHDPIGALDYARRLKTLSDEVADRLLLVMRVYFEKPRTKVGWKGLISDPYLDDSCDMHEGLRLARSLLAEIVNLGLPTACEMLDPITPQYLADLICWGAIGARTTESQTHREMASGLSFPVGFKNATNGDLVVAVNAMRSALNGHRFLGINGDGISCVVHTNGNPHVHIVLRGGADRPNHDARSVARTEALLRREGLAPHIMIDCSHANSGSDHNQQEAVAEAVFEQIAGGNNSIFGLMVESYLEAGNQPLTGDPSSLIYGVSVTDKCIDWTTTERLVQRAWDLAGA